MYWDKKMGGLRANTVLPKQTLKKSKDLQKQQVHHLGGLGDDKDMMRQGEGLVEPLVIFKSMFRQLFIMEPHVPRKARSCAVGFFNPVESLLLEGSQPLSIKVCLVERASLGCSPVFLSAICTLDDVVLGFSTCSSSVHAGFVVPGADSAPGGF